MKIGYACTPLITNARTNRRVLLKDFSHKNIYPIIEKNLNDLHKILHCNKDNDIYLFRIGSDIIPLGSHEINDFNWQKEFHTKLKLIGDFIRKNNMRVSMHPGQYTVINSPNEETLKKSLLDVEYHCSFLDSLEVDYKNKIILHIGGVYGDKPMAKENFIKGFSSLSESAQKRLIIENDEKSFSLDDVLEVSSKIHIPAIFDNLHNICFGDNSYTLNKIYSKVKKTWNNNLDGNIKVHYSQQDLNKKKGSHSQSIAVTSFLDYYNQVENFNPDIMLEVKDKDISAIKILKTLKEINIGLSKEEFSSEIENYKLLLLQYDKDFHENTYGNIVDFYKYLDEATTKEFDLIGFKYSLELAFNIIDDYMTKREISHFKKLIKEKDLKKAKLYLKKINSKIEIPPRELAYYFSRN
ncbi:UV DNA damage repair endonuclease UvsE [Clostridium sp. B9]|uniref:UV DNA damage repair endonuclease UvsE n=1 Tax=Clostridium sp. B9 TaxID=3423224 RepID=UPI003D2EF46B